MDNHVRGVQIGYNIETFNKWTYVDLPEIQKCFEQLSEEEKSLLKIDDTIWRDVVPKPKNGVYGFTLLKIMDVIKEGTETKIYTGTNDNEFFTLKYDDRSYKIKPDLKQVLINFINLSILS